MKMVNNFIRNELVVNICELTDNDVMSWSDLMEDGCRYTSQFEYQEWGVCCCKTSEQKRTLTINNEVTSLTDNDVKKIYDSIHKQKMRHAAQQQATVKAMAFIENYKMKHFKSGG